jgi:hypothetical protein
MSERQLIEPAPAHPADGAADSTTTPAIELLGVVRVFRSHGESVTAVRDMDVAIAEGEFFSLLEFGDGERIIVPAADARPGGRLEITVRPEKMTLMSGESKNPGAGGGGRGGAQAAGGRMPAPSAARSPRSSTSAPPPTTT